MAKKKLAVAKKPFVSKTNVVVAENYCRKCRETKLPKDFYTSVDFYLETNGLFSICKDCSIDIYENALIRERTIGKALLDTCRTLNIRYEESVVESVLGQIKKSEDKGRNPRPVLSTYLSRLKSMVARGKEFGDADDYRLTFVEGSSAINTPEDELLESRDEFWGVTVSTEDVEFLEKEYQKFREGFSSESYTETILLKRVCYKLLEIKKAQYPDGKGGVGKLEKELLILFKEMAISPAHASASKSGQMMDVYGVWLETIEKYSPAEWLAQKDRSMFRDIDNVELYFQNYIVRPIKNFFTGTPDYTLVDEDGNGVVDES